LSGWTVKTAMLGSVPLPLSGGLLETHHLAPKTDKGTGGNLCLQVGTKNQWADEWPKHSLSSLVAQQQHPLVTTATFSHPVTLLLLFHQLPLYPPQVCAQQWTLAVLLETPHRFSFLNKACADGELSPSVLLCLSSVLTHNLVIKWAKSLNRHFSKKKKDVQMANQSIKRHSLPLIIRKCQNHNEMPPHSCENGCDQKDKKQMLVMT
jgi:hypothetical protein